LKVSTKEFDEGFHDFVAGKLSEYKLLPAIQLDDPRDLVELDEDGEASVDDLVKLARWYFQKDKESTDARKWAGMAAKMGVESKELHYILGMLAKYDPSKSLSKAQQAAKAREHLSKAINMGLEDYYLYLEMAELAQQSNELDLSLFFLNRARRAFPTNPEPIRRLLGLYGGMGNEAKAQELGEDLVMLDENEVEVRKFLLNRYKETGDFEAAADMGLQLVYINPYDIDTHLERGRMLREMADLDSALFEFRRAYDAAVAHENAQTTALGKETALIEIFETYFREGKVDLAMQSFERLAAEFPGSSGMERIRKRIEDEDKETHFP
ncbi:MAG: hypothetical protein KDB07_08515, partial [Planctomycetes bacterium]|nr:hypothetical protein [Planctomycetota bacterium]